jgi:hypothetical protein
MRPSRKREGKPVGLGAAGRFLSMQMVRRGYRRLEGGLGVRVKVGDFGGL